MDNGTQLRRLPWTTDDGRPAYVQAGTGGPVNQMADVIESMAVEVAQDLARQGTRMARNQAASAEEMRSTLALLAASVKDLTQIAESRAERITALEEALEEAQERLAGQS